MTALLLIDLQKAIDDPSWGERNNPQAEANVARLLGAWRARGMPVYHVRHDSSEPQSTYRPGQPGHDFKPEVAPIPGEVVIAKRTNSAFILLSSGGPSISTSFAMTPHGESFRGSFGVVI